MGEENSDVIEIRAHDVVNNWWNKHGRLQATPVNESDDVYIERYNWWQLGRYMCTCSRQFISTASCWSVPNIHVCTDCAHSQWYGWEKMQLHELTQSMRQKDIKFVNCLNKIHKTVPLGGSEDRMLQSWELKLNSYHEKYPHDASMYMYKMCTVIHGMKTDLNCFLEENSQI